MPSLLGASSRACGAGWDRGSEGRLPGVQDSVPGEVSSPAHRHRCPALHLFGVVVGVVPLSATTRPGGEGSSCSSQLHLGTSEGVSVDCAVTRSRHDEMVFRDRDLARVAEHEASAASAQKAGIGRWPTAGAQPLPGRGRGARSRDRSTCSTASMAAPTPLPAFSLGSSASQACWPAPHLQPSAGTRRARSSPLVRRRRRLDPGRVDGHRPSCRRPSPRAISTTWVKQSLIARPCRRRNAFSAQ